MLRIANKKIPHILSPASSHKTEGFFVYLLLLIQMTVMVKEVTMDYLWSGLLFVVIFLIYGKEMLQMLKGFLGKRK